MPSFVTMTGPGTTTVTDDAAAAIILQTAALEKAFTLLQTSISLPTGLPAAPGSLIACLSGINASLARIADSDALIAKKLSDLNISTGAVAVASSSLTAVTSIAAANQIETNNKQVAATNEALKRAGLPEPTLPPLPEQLKESVVNGVALNQAAVASGAVTSFITTNTAALGTWITQTKVYTSVATWVEEAADIVVGVLPDSVRSLFAKAKGGA